MGTPQLFDLDEEGNAVDPNAGQSTDDQEVAEVTEEVPQEQEEQQEPELPEKYRGKSAAEIARMHMEVEKRLGQQGDEVGSLRKETAELRDFFDNYVQSQTVAQQASTHEDEEELDFYTDPQAAVQRAIESHPKVRQAEAVSQKLSQGAALAALQRKHPDFQQVVGSPEFIQWKDSKPGLSEMFQRADQGYDVDAADTLISLYKERQSTAQTAAEMDKQTRQREAKQSSTGNVAGAPPGKAAKRTYRRSDIRKLMISDPDQYQARQEEIMAAYREGRVV